MSSTRLEGFLAESRRLVSVVGRSPVVVTLGSLLLCSGKNGAVDPPELGTSAACHGFAGGFRVKVGE